MAWYMMPHRHCRRTTVPSVYCRCRVVGKCCTCWNWALMLQSFWRCGQRRSHEWPAGGCFVGLQQCPWCSFLRADEGRVDGLLSSQGPMFGEKISGCDTRTMHVQSCRSYTARAASFGLQRLPLSPTASEACGTICKSRQEWNKKKRGKPCF